MLVSTGRGRITRPRGGEKRETEEEDEEKKILNQCSEDRSLLSVVTDNHTLICGNLPRCIVYHRRLLFTG